MRGTRTKLLPWKKSTVEEGDALLVDEKEEDPDGYPMGPLRSSLASTVTVKIGKSVLGERRIPHEPSVCMYSRYLIFLYGGVEPEEENKALGL